MLNEMCTIMSLYHCLGQGTVAGQAATPSVLPLASLGAAATASTGHAWTRVRGVGFTLLGFVLRVRQRCNRREGDACMGAVETSD